MRVREDRIHVAITAALAASFCSSCALGYHDLAVSSIEDERYEIAVDYLEKGAAEGDVRCDYLLATLMMSGDLGGEPEPEAAAERMRRAAIGGLPVAQLDLGKLYETGVGVERDMALAAD